MLAALSMAEQNARLTTCKPAKTESNVQLYSAQLYSDFLLHEISITMNILGAHSSHVTIDAFSLLRLVQCAGQL